MRPTHVATPVPQEEKRLEHRTKRAAKEIFSGFCAGIVGTVIGHPMDTIKVRLQTQSQYNGAWDCFVKIIKYEGVRGLFKGMASPLVGLTFLNSLSFGAYAQLKAIQQKPTEAAATTGTTAELQSSQRQQQGRTTTIVVNGQAAQVLLPHQYCLAGMGTGFLCSLFSSPFEFVKIRMQLDNVSQRIYRNSLHCLTTEVKTHGPKILYRGCVPNTVREMVFGGTYFTMYEQMKLALNKQQQQQGNGNNNNNNNNGGGGGGVSHLSILVSGGMSGMCAWFASYPLDCIKSNSMKHSVFSAAAAAATATATATAATSSSSPVVSHASTSISSSVSPLPPPPSAAAAATAGAGAAVATRQPGMFFFARQIWQKEGIRGFYKGLATSVSRAFIVSSSRFYTYEVVLAFLSRDNNNNNSSSSSK